MWELHWYLTSYPFPKIKLEHECDPEPQLGNSIFLLDSIIIPVSLPDFHHFPKSVLDPMPVHRKLESTIFYDQHIELDQYHTFESFNDKLTSSHFYEIELRQECDFNPHTPVILELESPILGSHILDGKWMWIGVSTS